MAIFLFFGLFLSSHTEAYSPVAQDFIAYSVPIGKTIVISLDYNLDAIIAKFSVVYGVNQEELKKVMMCESSGRSHVYGDGGLAYGPMQFHKPTFYEFSKKLGEELDYHSAYDQIKLASYMFSLGDKGKRHWSCAKKLGIV